jgi:uncharacterized lipoprotein YddW (UPF0748 family)
MLQSRGWRQALALLILACVLAGCSDPENKRDLPQTPLTQKETPVRGVWLTTVYGLDWPPRASVGAVSDAERIRQQQQALLDKLDNMVRTGINTVFFQVKPDGAALYRSALLPWSAVLTGTMGKDPGYDPLAFIIEQAHMRGIKVHAWLNPYRVTMDTSPQTVAALNATRHASPASVYIQHPRWIRTASHRFVLDPGLPEVRDWITQIVSELLSRYALDGIQFDDYFYYETPDSRLDDSASWRQYGGGFASRDDWRRDNTLQLIRQVSNAIHTSKPGIAFGVSPSGIWRNAASDVRGSATCGGNTAYDAAFADTLQWVRQGMLDYIAPQLYWPFNRNAARYDTLVRWWANAVAGTRTRLYIGIALYKVNQSEANEPDWAIDGGISELKRQLDLNDNLPDVSGTILFREDFLHQPRTRHAVEYLRQRWAPDK